MSEGAPPRSGLREVLEQRSEWVDALIVLATVAVGFVVLDYLARYFADYLRIILIFFFAWLLAFLLSPAADFLQRRMQRLPRPLAVIGVLVPIILIIAFVGVRVVVALGDSFAQLIAQLPDLAANPPPVISQIQAWFDARGIAVDIAGIFHQVVVGLLDGMANFVVSLFGGISSSVGTLIDGIIVVSLAVFMAIDRDKIMRFGLDMTAPEHREDALLFRRSIGTAFAGFIRSQLVLGALYAVWAFGVNLIFGLPFAGATAFLAGIIMAIPIYGPYVSWVPPVIVAVLLKPEVAIFVAIAMLIGWFIDENILAPLVRAGALQLHPIVVTFAFLLGAQLAGAIGALVAIPLAAVVQAFFWVYLDRYRAKRGWPPAGSEPLASEGPPGPDEPPPGGDAGDAAPATPASPATG